MSIRRHGLVTLVVLAALALLLAVAVPSAKAWGCWGGGGSGSGSSYGNGNGWCSGGYWNGTGAKWGGTGAWGTGGGTSWLLDHPSALRSWLDQRAQQLDGLRKWHDQYRANPRGATAQRQLRGLWRQSWNGMRDWYRANANGAPWTSPTSGCWGSGMWGSGFGAAWLLKNGAAFDVWLALRAGQISDVRQWLQDHAGALHSPSAVQALHTLRADHRAAVRAFFEKYGIATGARWGYCGWKGLGGMWGGWGW